MNILQRTQYAIGQTASKWGNKILQNTIKNTINNQQRAISLSDFGFDNSINNAESDMLNGVASTVSTLSNMLGMEDITTNADDLRNMTIKDPSFMGLYDTLIKAMFKNSFWIEPRKDKDNALIGSESEARRLQQLLDDNNYNETIELILGGLWADGGGNVLMFPTGNNGKTEHIQVEPFLRDGRVRVSVLGNTIRKTITNYTVLDDERHAVPGWSFDPIVDPMAGLRYRASGDYKISSNPAKMAVYWYVFKNNIAGSSNASYNNGLPDPMVMTPDYASIAPLISAVTNGANLPADNQHVGGIFSDPIGYLAQQSGLDDQTLRQLKGQKRRTGSLLKLKFPQKFISSNRTNKSMEAMALIAYCDLQIQFAMRTSMTVINTKDAKYSNAEVERDNWKEFVLSPEKKRIEDITERYILPWLDPTFDVTKYAVRFGRDPNQESIDIYEAKTARNASISQIIATLSTTENYKYNLETNEIEEVNTSDSKGKKEVTNDDIVEDNDSERSSERSLKKKSLRAKKVPTPAEIALKTKEAKRFYSITKNAIVRKLNKFVSNMEKQETKEDVDSKFDSLMPTLAQSGLTVLTMRQQLEKFVQMGVDDFEKNDSQKTRLSDELQDITDAKAQLLIKGWDSLTDAQKKLLEDNFGDLAGYVGLDGALNSQILTILRDCTILSLCIEQVNQAIARISENKAIEIIESEIPQSIENTRRTLYLDAGYDIQSWLTVQDRRVRKGHRANQAQGFIPINETFSNGARSPADEIACRCTVEYRRS